MLSLKNYRVNRERVSIKGHWQSRVGVELASDSMVSINVLSTKTGLSVDQSVGTCPFGCC